MNYQYLHYDFFITCRKRKINKVPMLLLIYLRGLYSRFGNIFTWKDSKGQEPTQYLILDSVLAPERVVKNKVRLDKIAPRYGHIVPSIYKSYENNKDKIPFKRWQGMSDQDRELLKSKGLL